MSKQTPTRLKRAEQERAERLAFIKPAETMTVEELEIIEIYRSATPKVRAAMLTVLRIADGTGGA
jgi:ABC-type microcin C transport system permease subunit YejE